MKIVNLIRFLLRGYGSAQIHAAKKYILCTPRRSGSPNCLKTDDRFNQIGQLRNLLGLQSQSSSALKLAT